MYIVMWTTKIHLVGVALVPGSHKLSVGDGEKRAWSALHVHVQKPEGIQSFTDIMCLLASILSFRMRLRL